MIIRNGLVALPGQDNYFRLDLRIQKGRITEIGLGLEEHGEILDASGLVILPGGLDPHVHFDDPGYTDREDFLCGSKAAVAGGITTVIDMPCTSVPPVTSKENLQAKLAAVKGKSLVDYGFFGGVCAQSFNEYFPAVMEDLASQVFGFKTYFISGMDTFHRLDHHQFMEVLMRASSLGRPVLLHAEDYDYITSAEVEWRMKGNSPVHYGNSRPEVAETLAVESALTMANATGADLHIVHLSTGQAAEMLRTSRVSGETCPHYLAFDSEDFARIGSSLKVTPPVKTAPNREKLWSLLAEGVIDFVASDHAPCPTSGKQTGSIWTDYAGIPGTGTLLPYLFSEGLQKGRLRLSRFVDSIASVAAARYGLAGRKGSIEVGKDADLVLLNPQSSWTVDGRDFFSKGKVTPFQGVTLQGKVMKTILRGRVIYDAERGIVADPGSGEFLKP